jgi:MFS family permease
MIIRSSLIRPLQSSAFRLYWIGRLVSQLGDHVFVIAQAWLVYQLTGSPAAMVTVTLASQIPSIAFVLLGGALADRLDRRRVAITSDVLRGMLLLLLTALLWQNRLGLVHLVALAAGFGLVSAWSAPAFRGLVQSLAPEADRASVSSLLSLGGTLVSIGGPVLGGIVMAAGGAKLAFLLDGLSFFAGALGLWLARVVLPAPVRSGEPLPGRGAAAVDRRTDWWRPSRALARPDGLLRRDLSCGDPDW